MFGIQSPLKDFPRITPRYQKLLEKQGLLTVEDLLFYFPVRYDDFSRVVAPEEKYLNQVVTVEGKIIQAKLTRIFRRRLTLFEIVIQGQNRLPLKALWFNQPYLGEALKPEVVIRLSGKLTLNKKFLFMSNPAWELSQRENTNTGRIVPVYRETKGLSSKWLRWQIKKLLPFSSQAKEIVPLAISQKYNLYPLAQALGEIHFSASLENRLRAQKTFAFREMFLIQLKSLQSKKQWEKNQAPAVKFDQDLIKNFVKQLPFQLTDGQRKASFEILKDLEKVRPMNRLLNGDVGSGKTIVAAVAALQTIKRGYQVALMTPTEVLARQHFFTLGQIFKDSHLSSALLTNSYRELGTDQKVKASPAKKTSFSRKKLLEKISAGEINLIVGTQALIQKGVAFKNLALVIIDEQHRFGVAQRAFLQQSVARLEDGSAQHVPHLLTLTATPIPRTLAIAFSGYLDLSLLEERPQRRKKIITRIIPATQRKSAYAFLKSQVALGRQIFIILPLVEESETLSHVKAATQEYQRLSEEIFPDLKIGLLHGRLKTQEKEAVMKKFQEKKLDLLVSTSVIEVGIDIPNASVMVIEDAERFGLSQLHQFRGRVGRSEHQSYCLLFTNLPSEKSADRLKALVETENGFEIAEKDLRLRGPGQFFGTLQAGRPDIAMENLMNIRLIKLSQMEAKNILAKDPDLKKHPLIKAALEKFQDPVHLE